MKLGIRNIRTKPGKSNMLVGGKKVIMIMVKMIMMVWVLLVEEIGGGLGWTDCWQGAPVIMIVMKIMIMMIMKMIMMIMLMIMQS